MTKKIDIAEDGKMDRLKANWKKLAIALLGVGAIVYFILTGQEIDFSKIAGLLQ